MLGMSNLLVSALSSPDIAGCKKNAILIEATEGNALAMGNEHIRSIL